MKRPLMFIAAGVLAVTASSPSWAEKTQASNIIEIPAPPAGNAQVVWFRRGGAGFIVGCSVNENGAKISSLGAGRYFVMQTTPGTHIFTVASEATDTLVLDLQANVTTYAECKIKMGILIGRPKIELSNEASFRSKSKSLKLVDADDQVSVQAK